VGEPPRIDVESYLDDPPAELQRCAGEHFYAIGLGLDGQPMPWVLEHGAVRSLLRDRRLSPRSFVDDMLAAGLSRQTAEQLTPLFRRDGDEHRHHRALLSAAFTPRRVERLRPIAAEVAGRLADGLVARGGRGDFVEAFATPLPSEVFAGLFGLPPEDRDRLARWSAVVAQAFAPLTGPEQVAAVESAAADLRAYCGALVARRRAEPADDLVTHLLEAEVDGERLDDTEVIATMSGFIFAGSETTRRQLTALISVFAAHPYSWERLAAAPDGVDTAVVEVLRHRSIVPALSRVAVEPFEHDDLELAPGGRLLASFETANHDPAVFDDPQTFDVERANAAEHVTFGWGPHFCLGAGLARLELQESLRALLARFGPPALVDGAAPSPVGVFAAPDSLVVEFPLR
jgi:cytochrome P450